MTLAATFLTIIPQAQVGSESIAHSIIVLVKSN